MTIRANNKIFDAFGGGERRARSANLATATGQARSSPPFFKNGLTVIEMLVSTTCLIIIVIGLTAMFVETQRVFKAGTKQNSMTDAGQSILDLVASDLSQLSDADLSPGSTNLITNLYWGWNPTNTSTQIADGATVPYRTNQLQTIFMLVKTNLQWVGIGYAISNGAGGAGTLYRYQANINDPLYDNAMYYNFVSSVNNQMFNSNFSRVADGVVHLKIRAYDPTGNEPYFEQGMDEAPNGDYFSYPAAGYVYLSGGNAAAVVVPSTDLPASLQLEVGVLEPDAYLQLRVLPPNRTLQQNFLAKVGGKIQIYRRNIPVAAVMR